MKILLIFMFPLLVYANEIEDARRSVEALIQPLITSNSKKSVDPKSKFRTDQCKVPAPDWGKILMGQDAKIELRFKEGCDLEGTIRPMIFKPFPANLKLRNLVSFNEVSSINQVSADLQDRPVLNLFMTEGKLTGKDSKVKFHADYKMRILHTGMENLGGTLNIVEINGKKVSISEKIMIK